MIPVSRLATLVSKRERLYSRRRYTADDSAVIVEYRADLIQSAGARRGVVVDIQSAKSLKGSRRG